MQFFKSLILVAIFLSAPEVPAINGSADDCSDAAIRSFDFLIGEWNEKDKKGGMSITKNLEGCGTREVWKLEDFNAVLLRSYDSSKKTWYLTFTAHDLVPQVWTGKDEKGLWVFYRDWDLNGIARRSRTFWKSTSKSGFEKIVEQLNDDGKTWRLHDRAIFERENTIKTRGDDMVELLRLHKQAQTAHLTYNAELFVSMFADQLTQIQGGKVLTRDRKSNLERFCSYFKSYKFEAWDNIVPPVIEISDDGTMATVRVQKRVIGKYKDEDGKEHLDKSIFAWLEVWKKVNGKWRVFTVASTSRYEK